jgi:hypothetical protein
MVTPYALVLFGGPLEVLHQKLRLSMDGGWVQFIAEPRIGALVKALRARLQALLTLKIEAPDADISRDPVVSAIIHLLKVRGLAEIQRTRWRNPPSPPPPTPTHTPTLTFFPLLPLTCLHRQTGCEVFCCRKS